jgi:dipeptidyl aminopeptidase/acylaminoacyl peptidase
MRKYQLFALSACFWMLVGCGGGGSGTQAVSTGPSKSLQLGQMSIKYNGIVQPASMLMGSITAISMAGATFDKLEMIPNHTLSNTVMAYTAQGALYCYQNGASTDITGTKGYDVFGAECTGDGRIGFTAFDADHVSNGIFACNYDGSNTTLILDNGNIAQDVVPSFSPNGQKLAFVGTNGNLYVASMNGQGLKSIASGADYISPPAWSPDSTHIAYAKTSSPEQIWIVPAAGGAQAQLTSTEYESGDWGFPCYTPDGRYIAVSNRVSGGSWNLFLVEANDGYPFSLSTPSGSGDLMAACAPDSSTIGFFRYGSTNFGNIYTENVSGQDSQIIVNSSLNLTSLSWSPYFANHIFIGSGGGSLSPTAVGFVWTQLDDGFASLASFTAASASGSTITQLAEGGDFGEVVYDLHAASLTGLQWTNGYYNPPTQIAASGTDALLTISENSGLVETVVPLLVPGARADRQGSKVVFSGKFAAFYTADGVNHAPGGATQVVWKPDAKLVLSVR